MSAEPNAPRGANRGEDVLRVLLPVALLALGVLAWDLVVRLKGIPPYVLPAPGLVLATLIADWPLLQESLLATLTTTLLGFLLALVGGVGLAVLFNLSRVLESALYASGVILAMKADVLTPRLLIVYLHKM